MASPRVRRGARTPRAGCRQREGWVTVTRSGWFDFLATRPFREAVNVWSPSDYDTFRGSAGAPFFFKLTAPRHAIGGFGYVDSFAKLPDWLAWDCFGDGNGAAPFDDFKRRLHGRRERNRLRGASPSVSQIGCIVRIPVC